MRKITFTAEAWSDYLFWEESDQQKLKKINRLIAEIVKTPYKGTGNPEPLKFTLKGYWSRRIDQKERLIYRADDDKILIISCKGHY